MNKSPLFQGGSTTNPVRSGPVNRGMAYARSRELAVLAGRTPPYVAQADYEQAKRELTGESDAERQDAILDGLPESARWDPVSGSLRHQATESSSEEEDDERRNESAPLGSREARLAR